MKLRESQRLHASRVVEVMNGALRAVQPLKLRIVGDDDG